jgi:drug/metabolite transporter (DMT)-like permease
MVAFASSPLLVRLAMSTEPGAPALEIAFWRTGWAALLLSLPMLLWRRQEVRRLGRDDLVRIGAAGLFLALHFVLWIEALRHTSVASASVLVSIHPIFLALLGYWWLRERLSRPTIVGILLATVGGMLIGWGDAQIGSEAFPAASWGNALAVSSALCFTGYLLLGRLLRQRLSWLPYVGMLYGATALVVGLWFLLSGPGWEARTWRFYGLCLLMALGPQIIGHGTLNYVVRFISPAVVALLVLGEPLLASWGAYMLWGEVPSPISALGMGLTLSGLLLAWWRTGGR